MKFIGKKLATVTAPTPSYTTNHHFLGKFASFYTAADFDSLHSATAVAVERVRLDFKKNVTDYQAVGDTDVTGLLQPAILRTGRHHASVQLHDAA